MEPSIISLLKSGVVFGSEVFEIYNKWKQSKFNVRSKIQMLYFECFKNIELIKIIINKHPKDRRLAISCVKALENVIIQMVFIDYDLNKTIVKFEKKDDNDNDNDNDIPENVFINAGLGELCAFACQRIEILRAIVAMNPSKGKEVMRINYHARLKNIMKCLLNICIKIENNNGITKSRFRITNKNFTM